MKRLIIFFSAVSMLLLTAYTDKDINDAVKEGHKKAETIYKKNQEIMEQALEYSRQETKKEINKSEEAFKEFFPKNKKVNNKPKNKEINNKKVSPKLDQKTDKIPNLE